MPNAPTSPTATSPATAAPEPVAAPSVPSVVPAARVGTRHLAPPLPRSPRARRPDGLTQVAGRLLAAAFGIAWFLCPLVEPMPAEHVHYPLWQLPIDLAAVASIVVAVIVLWRGGRSGPRLGAIAGVLMAVETIVCPWAGHTPLGWWTWAQTGLSLFVLGTSAFLMARASRRATAAPVVP
jgi:hypothetical protein